MSDPLIGILIAVIGGLIILSSKLYQQKKQAEFAAYAWYARWNELSEELETFLPEFEGLLLEVDESGAASFSACNSRFERMQELVFRHQSIAATSAPLRPDDLETETV